MTSKVLDLTTMGHALNELCNAFLGDCEWISSNDQQLEFLSWYAEHRDEIVKLSDLEALASTDFVELNKFLVAHGFDAMFDPFTGIGVAAILDMLIEWTVKGMPTTITRRTVDYPAFGLAADDVDIYDEALAEPLVRLHTKTGHSLWLMKSSEPASGLELNRQAQQLLTETALRPSYYWNGVTVPMLEMDMSPDISWMLGITAISPTRGEYEIAQVFQKFKLRANDKGARVKVATGMVMRCSASPNPRPEPYVFNEPFIGFFTQPGNDKLPLAAFWADTDTWQEPAGTLEEL
jgi:hypothetical protein